MSVECVYAGYVIIGQYGDDDEALFLDDNPGEPLAARFAADLDSHGRTVSVSYWIADGPRTLAELLENEAAKAAGAADAAYRQVFSEITGYLWTDATLTVGGHDLLAELASYEGSWCRLAVRFGEREENA